MKLIKELRPLLILWAFILVMASIACNAVENENKRRETILVNAVMNDSVKSVTFSELEALKKYPKAYAYFTRNWTVKL